MDFIFNTIRSMSSWHLFFLFILSVFVLTPLTGAIGMVIGGNLGKYITGSTPWGAEGFLIGVLVGSVVPIIIVWVGTDWTWYWKVLSYIMIILLGGIMYVAMLFLLFSSMKFPTRVG